jgi:hypothetical protein
LSFATGQHRLPRMDSGGSPNCIASKLNCVVLIRGPALQVGRNDQRHWSPTCRRGSYITAPAWQRSLRSARHWPTSPNTGSSLPSAPVRKLVIGYVKASSREDISDAEPRIRSRYGISSLPSMECVSDALLRDIDVLQSPTATIRAAYGGPL